MRPLAVVLLLVVACETPRPTKRREPRDPEPPATPTSHLEFVVRPVTVEHGGPARDIYAVTLRRMVALGFDISFADAPTGTLKGKIGRLEVSIVVSSRTALVSPSVGLCAQHGVGVPCPAGALTMMPLEAAAVQALIDGIAATQPARIVPAPTTEM